MDNQRRHEWADGTREFILEADGSIYEIPDVGESPQVGEIPQFVARELFRAIQAIKDLRAQLAVKEGTLAMAIARLGGEVEGAPTHRINFLQRIDALREIERQHLSPD